MITEQRIPGFVRLCQEDLTLTQSGDKWIVENCENRNECSGCPMCNPAFQLILTFDPLKIINYKEIRDFDSDDHEQTFLMGERLVNNRPYYGSAIMVKQSVIEECLDPYVQSEEQWYYYRDFVCDEDTLIVYQLQP
jgi:hypothetical protein